MNEFLPYYDFAIRYAKKLCKDEELAADLVQDVFLRIGNKSFQEINHKAYLTMAIKNTFINHIRVKARFGDMDDVYEMSFQIEDKTKKGSENLMSDLMKKALETVPTDNKIPFLLCELYDYTYKEISEIVSCPIGTIRTRIFYAKKIIREYILSNRPKSPKHQIAA